jgi:glycosyltransferase involved in cell wall biosynthesis
VQTSPAVRTPSARHRLTPAVRLAILGTRGIPANYGGFETFAQELGARLASRGHDVTVYCRSHYVPKTLTEYRGMRLVVLPTIRHKYLDTVVHTSISAVHAMRRRFDVILICNAANALVSGLPRLVGTRVALNVDGLERNRRKWNALGRFWYLTSERLATWMPDAVVTDARVIEDYYRQRYSCPSAFIPYGCDIGKVTETSVLEQFGLAPDGYVLYVSRLEPENNAMAVIDGFEATNLSRKLVIVGDAPYARQYIEQLRQRAGQRVVFTGGVYGEGYRQLQSHAFAYVHATEVGGTHPALVEAMGFGNCVVVNDVPENREVAGDAALYFDARASRSLTAILEALDRDPAQVEALRSRALNRVRSTYSWDHVTDEYEALFHQLLEDRRSS